MKKNIIIFILCCIMSASCLSVSAQQAVTQAQFPYDITKTIVKELSFPKTVSYVETTNSHYFCYADNSMTVNCHEIDPNIFVRDFKILDDVVYFCGYDITNGCQGVWGHFRVVDLMSGSMPYETYRGFSCSKNTVDTLHNLVVYSINGKNHIVTVGTTNDGASLKNGCTIDITPSTSGIYAWDYTIGITPDATDERIKYVCETDNLVVTAGSSSLFPEMETYRVHKKNNIFSTTGMQDNIWYFSYSNTYPFVRNTNKFAITHTHDDNMAMAFYAKDLNFFLVHNPNYHCILYYEYDMSALTLGVISTLNSLAVSTFQYPFEVEDLVYSSTNNSLSLLITGSLPITPLSGNGSIVAEITPGSYPANLHGLPNIELHSIDNYNSQNNYVCLGKDMTNNQFATFYTQPINTNFSCTNNMPYGNHNPTFLTKMHKYPYILCTDSFNCLNNISDLLKQLPNTITCQ